MQQDDDNKEQQVNLLVDTLPEWVLGVIEPQITSNVLILVDVAMAGVTRLQDDGTLPYHLVAILCLALLAVARALLMKIRALFAAVAGGGQHPPHTRHVSESTGGVALAPWLPFAYATIDN